MAKETIDAIRAAELAAEQNEKNARAEAEKRVARAQTDAVTLADRKQADARRAADEALAAARKKAEERMCSPKTRSQRILVFGEHMVETYAILALLVSILAVFGVSALSI